MIIELLSEPASIAAVSVHWVSQLDTIAITLPAFALIWPSMRNGTIPRVSFLRCHGNREEENVN